MSRLILLNGPPAGGKSTLARRFVDEHPLALNLDVDRVRDLIGAWRDNPDEAGLLAREIALAAARVHLTAGHDVVVPQFLGRLTFIEQLAHLASEAGAAFHEIVLLDSKENTLRRFAERSRSASGPSVAEPELSAMYDRLMSIIEVRPGAVLVHVEDGEMDVGYQGVLRCLEHPR